MANTIEWEYEEIGKLQRRPKLTVLMSVYNADQYVRSAIESILQQNHKDFEFIIFDDASTDSSRDIICSYADIRIQRFFSKHNVGQAMLYNYGIHIARGDYIAIMDSDDISLSNRFTRQITYLEQNRDISICGTWAKIFGIFGEIVWKQPVEFDDIRCFLLFDSPFIQPTIMMRRFDLIQYQLFYDEKNRYAEDYDFWAKCSIYLKMANIPEVLLKYRRSPGQITTAHRTEQLQAADTTRERLLIRYFGASEEEIAIHNRLFRPTDQWEVVEKVKEWLAILVRYNHEQKIYDTKVFQKVISLHWQRFCNRIIGQTKKYKNNLSKYTYKCTYKE